MVKRNIAEATKADEGCRAWHYATAQEDGAADASCAPSAGSCSPPPFQLACDAQHTPAADSMPVSCGPMHVVSGSSKPLSVAPPQNRRRAGALFSGLQCLCKDALAMRPPRR